jgi:protein subunit release factor A
MTNTQLYTTDKEQLYKDTDVRVIDQRIGMGIGGLNTVIRLYHKPTGILIEMPKMTRSQYYDRELAFEMLELALTKIEAE